MKFNKVNALMIIAMCGMLIGCKNKSGDVVTGSPYSGLNGKAVKRVYESLTSSGIATLNYYKTSSASDARNFANFIDGLLTHNDFGTLELNLAESASHNADYTEFVFKVRQDPNLVWVTFEGKPYEVNGEVQYVKAEDFVSGAKVLCNYSTQSQTVFMMQDFISGALEYYLYTKILDGQAQGINNFVKLNTPAKQANYIQTQIEENYENVYEDGGYADNPVEAEHIPLIAAGKRLGVIADPENRTVTYKLMKPAMFFPTMLTYSCYMPVNEAFYKEKGAKFGAASRDAILYNGPFILSQLDETNIIYTKNQYYAQRADIHGYNTVHVDTIKYNIIKTDIDETYTRTQFEAGNIDGFSISPNDTVGWSKYITGPDGSGTLEDPYDGLVNSRILDTVGYAYGSNLVLERSTSNGGTSYYSGGSLETIKNTEKALRLQDVRKAIMAAFDYPTYYQRYANGDSESILARENLVSTYVPKNFVYDDNGNEYTETYYAPALAAKRGITVEEAKQLIEVGTWEHRHYATDDKDPAKAAAAKEALDALMDKAYAAIEAYNNDAAMVAKYGAISTPINIEYFSAWDNATVRTYDSMMILSMNKRLNKVSDVGGNDLSNCTMFRVYPTDQYKSNDNDDKISGKDSSSGASFDFSPVLWGWGPDYGDPLTYMNTYTKGGDWSSIFPYIAKEYVPNIKVNGSTVTESDLLAEYTALVKQGKVINENLTARYQKFAEAEAVLIEDLAIYMPQTNDGQGWSISISKAAGYECPTANYGLSNDRLTGMWVLQQPLTREERKAIRAEQEAAKKAWNDTHPAYNIYGN